ncbi:SPOR domain-containing protein [Microbacterium sp. gxy059]|uniref:SPOR domain-containing protein n=1 Tax=Microbacterium sp. gxy059 TaxID=2957199 RepID=UPI003D998BDC
MAEKYWYNSRTGEVEKGPQSLAIDRVGPFDTAEEAARAPEVLRERAKSWEEDEERESEWPGADGR